MGMNATSTATSTTRRRTWPGALGLCVALAAGGGVPGAIAAEAVWNAGIGDWDIAANWNRTPPGVPDGGDLAIVNNGGTAEATGSVQVRDLFIGSGFGGGTFLGTVTVGLDLLAGQRVDVGRVSGAGSSGTGTLAVQRDLQGLLGVGVAFQATPVGAPTTAQGTVTVGRDLRTAPLSLFEVGVAVNAATTGTGAVTVTGTVTPGTVTPGSSQSWSIGGSTGGTAVGSFSAGTVDTSTTVLNNLRVGVASGGGTATGTLGLGSGDLRVGNDTFIGVVGTQTGGDANGTLTLGGRLVSTDPASSLLQVGSGVGGSLPQDNSGKATGSLTAEGLTDWRFVDIGSWQGVRGDGVDGRVAISGSATVGNGGVVYTPPVPTTGISVLRVGFARLDEVNATITGPGAQVQGSLNVSGPVSGYDVVEIGGVLRSGDAKGTVTLDGGALSTGTLRIGQYVPYNGSNPATGLQARTDGRLSVVDGSVSATDFALVGSSAAPAAGDSLQGTLQLERSGLDTPFLRVGHGGTVAASDDSILTVARGTGVLGSAAAPALMTLDASRLVTGDAAAVPAEVGLSVGNAAFGTLRAQAGSTVEVRGNAAIGAGVVGGDGRLELQASRLTVSGSATVGGSVSAQRGRLGLHDSSASIDGNLQLGGSVNLGNDFGEAALEIYGSLLSVGGALNMDLGAQSWFGIDSLMRSSLDGAGELQIGYGAIDAGSAQLAGLIGVDFAGLALAEATTSALFDLIAVSGALTGGFASVDFLNVPLGYAASWAVVDLGNDGSVWRVALNQQTVPLPGTLALGLLALAAMGAAGTRPRRSAPPPAPRR
jgi:hypothetical protein